MFAAMNISVVARMTGLRTTSASAGRTRAAGLRHGAAPGHGPHANERRGEHEVRGGVDGEDVRPGDEREQDAAQRRPGDRPEPEAERLHRVRRVEFVVFDEVRDQRRHAGEREHLQQPVQSGSQEQVPEAEPPGCVEQRHSGHADSPEEVVYDQQPPPIEAVEQDADERPADHDRAE